MKKKVSKIPTEKLVELKQKAINSYLNEQKDNNVKTNIRLEGSNPSIPSFINVYHNNNLIKQLINNNNLGENLIKTHPIEKAFKSLTRKFQLSPDQIQIETIELEAIVVRCLIIFLPLNIDKNTIGDIKHEMNLYGYFTSQGLVLDTVHNFYYILFEPNIIN